MGFQPPSQIWCTIDGAGRPPNEQLAPLPSCEGGRIVIGEGVWLANSNGDDSLARWALPPDATPLKSVAVTSSEALPSPRVAVTSEEEPPCVRWMRRRSAAAIVTMQPAAAAGDSLRRR